eukprot:jgi/Mesvir1/29049/Mv18358-RA.1
MSSKDQQPNEVCERDPTGRFLRYSEELGRGGYKIVYKGFDTHLGIEVAWNKVKINQGLGAEEKERLYKEVDILGKLKNEYIITFYGSWKDETNHCINFITELFTSGSLRDFRKKHKDIDILDAVKRWGRQILNAMKYMHEQNPPIIHRDLKSDNIFVNGHTGQVKVADLGLATLMRHAQRAQTVIGTPEFMAPELYDEHYDERVDIYSFGMCLLELATLRFPYDECKTAAQIYKLVCQHKPPAALEAIENPDIKAIVKMCISPSPDDRMSAAQMLQLDFFREMPVPGAVVAGGSTKYQVKADSSVEDSVIKMHLRYLNKDGKYKNANFCFDLREDTANGIAEEMMECLELDARDAPEVARLIDNCVHDVANSKNDRAALLKRNSSSLHDLVHLASATKSAPGVFVEDAVQQGLLRVRVTAHDRKNLLMEITMALSKLPIAVKSAAINTGDDGMVTDVFEISVEAGHELRKQAIKEHLEGELKL